MIEWFWRWEMRGVVLRLLQLIAARIKFLFSLQRAQAQPQCLYAFVTVCIGTALALKGETHGSVYSVAHGCMH
jgi:hypothetical protein